MVKNNHLRVPENFSGTSLTAEQYRELAGDSPVKESLSHKIPKKPALSKYKNVKTECDGFKFDSTKEKNRYLYLKELINRGLISNLQRQVRFDLIPTNNLHRGVYYVADFTYIKDNELIIEDVKPFDKKRQKYLLKSDYIIKKKLMYHIFKIIIKEV